MYSPKDDIELLIADLRNIHISLSKYQSSQVKSSINYLLQAITILQAYKNEVNQREFEPEPFSPGRSYNVEKNIIQGKIYSNASLSQQSNSCGPGMHWVRRVLKDGRPGYCRSNPTRK